MCDDGSIACLILYCIELRCLYQTAGAGDENENDDDADEDEDDEEDEYDEEDVDNATDDIGGDGNEDDDDDEDEVKMDDSDGVPIMVRATSSVQVMLSGQQQDYERQRAEFLLNTIVKASADVFREGLWI